MNNAELFNTCLELGYKFQNYVESLFPSPIYSIVHRTSHYQDSKTLMDNLPDLIIRANYNNSTFAVECKFRSYIQDKNFLLKKDQLDLFKGYRDKNNMDIFIVLGSVDPIKPDAIYVIPLKDKLFKIPYFGIDFLTNFKREHNGYFIYDKGILR